MTHRRIRVAIVAASLRILGGQSVQAQRILDGFRDDAEVDAWLVPIDPQAAAPIDRLQRIKFIRTVITQLAYWPLLLRELRRADVVHVFSASYFSFVLAPLPAIIVGRLLGKPVLLNYHSGEAPDHLAKSPLARVVLRRIVQHNVVPSPFLRDVFRSFGISAQVVANSIDLDRFAYRPRACALTAPREGAPYAAEFRRGPRLLSTRSLEPMYNVACTLRAFALVQRAHPEAELTVIGGGSQRSALEALAASLMLRNVRFAGAVPPQRIHEHYAEADVYVQTPRIDNMPLSVLEAFASGVPVVSTRVGGVPAILTDGVHGYLAPDDDAEAVAAQVLAALGNTDETRRRAAAARATCTRYDWSAVREQWVAAYRSLAAGSRLSAAAALEGHS